MSQRNLSLPPDPVPQSSKGTQSSTRLPRTVVLKTLYGIESVQFSEITLIHYREPCDLISSRVSAALELCQSDDDLIPSSSLTSTISSKQFLIHAPGRASGTTTLRCAYSMRRSNTPTTPAGTS